MQIVDESVSMPEGWDEVPIFNIFIDSLRFSEHFPSVYLYTAVHG